jgi:hypothetical protein
MTRARCYKCGFRPCRCKDLRAGYSKAQAAKGSWPIESDAAGVHPSQIPAAMAEAKRLGVRVEFKKNGAAIFDTPRDRKNYTRAIGLVDRSSFC